VNSENVVKNLRALWRTDQIMADIRMRHMLVGLGLRAFAALIAGFGLLMLELSAYFALIQVWSAISAAAILGVVNFVIAAVLFVIAGRPPAGRELELASEIHGSAVDALQIEARAMQSQFTGMVHHPLNGVLPLLLAPLITIIVKSLRKSKVATAPSSTGRGGKHLITAASALSRKKERYQHVKDPTQAYPECFPAGAVSANPHCTGPRARPSRRRRRSRVYLRRASRYRRPYRSEIVADAS
jgi:hypothetical protein